MSALRKVLVVDDDAVVGKSFDRVLSKKGYIVTTAQNAHEALEQMRTQEFDLVYTDIKMPGMDGVELAEQVKASRPWTPVVIITGFGSTDNEVRAKAAGVSDFMRKPLSPEMIEESAAHALLEPAPVALAPVAAVVAPELHVEAAPQRGAFKTVAMLLAAPFIGLAYAVFMPLAGLATLLWLGAKALVKTEAARQAPTFLKNVALLLAAPFIGLAYALALPFVGAAMLAITGVKALRATPAGNKALGNAVNVAKFVAAPFIGLAYAVMLPLVGVAMLVWVGVKALRATKQAT